MYDLQDGDTTLSSLFLYDHKQDEHVSRPWGSSEDIRIHEPISKEEVCEFREVVYVV